MLNLAVFVGQKLFSCHMCNTSFSTKGSLKVHMRLHTGSKPFKCPYCDLRFRTSGHRKTHIQFHFRGNSDRHKSKRFSSSSCQSSQGETGQPGTGGQGQSPAAAEALQSVGLLQASSSDPNIYLPTNQVLTGQFDQNLLQPGLVGQTILPASMSGRFIVGDRSLHPDQLRLRKLNQLFWHVHNQSLEVFIVFLLKITLAFFCSWVWLQNDFDLHHTKRRQLIKPEWKSFCLRLLQNYSNKTS